MADSRGAVRLRLFTPDLRPEQYPDFDVRVGQSVSFLATRLQRRNGERQVISSRNWRLEAQNQTIYVLEPSNELDACGADQDCQAAEAERYEGQLVRVNGILGPDADGRAGQICGGDNRCWGIKYGTGDEMIRLRSRSNLLDTGECVTVVAPLSYFRGRPRSTLSIMIGFALSKLRNQGLRDNRRFSFSHPVPG